MARTKQTARTQAPAGRTSNAAIAPSRGNNAPLIITQAKNLDCALWVHLFGFVGDARTFRALELTCKQFRNIFKHDDIWKACFKDYANNVVWREHSWEDLYKSTWRDEAFCGILCQRIQHWQRNHTGNILLETYGLEWIQCVERWVNNSVWIYENQDHPAVTHKFVLRGDTAYTLACIVEEYLLQLLRQALLIAIQSSHRPEGHMVLPRDIQLAKTNQSTMDVDYLLFTSSPPPNLRLGGGGRNDDNNNNRITSYRYMRKLAYKAGIAKFDTMIDIDTIQLLERSYQLTYPACLELVSRSTTAVTATSSSSSSNPPPSSSFSRRILRNRETTRNTSPNPQLRLAEDPQQQQQQQEQQDGEQAEGGREQQQQQQRTYQVWTHVIVPGQIEAAAERLRFPYTKLYHGNGWFATTNNGEEWERENALNMYASSSTSSSSSSSSAAAAAAGVRGGRGREEVQEEGGPMELVVDYDDVSMYDEEESLEGDEEEEKSDSHGDNKKGEKVESTTTTKTTTTTIDVMHLRKLQAYIDARGRAWVMRPENQEIVQKCLGSGVGFQECLRILDGDKNNNNGLDDDDEDLKVEDYDWEEVQQPNWIPRKQPPHLYHPPSDDHYYLGTP